MDDGQPQRQMGTNASEGAAVSYVVFFEMYGYRPLAVADVRAAFGPGAQVDEGTPLEGGFRVGFGGGVFSIREGASPVSTEDFVREFARDKGMGEFTHVFAVEVDGEDFDGLEVEGDGSAVLIERFSALAGRMGGACAMLDMHMQAYDPAADRTYDLSAPAGGGLPPAGRALALTWYGILGGAPGQPVERLLELCAQRYPDLLPREFERDGRRLPLDERVRDYLVGPDFNEARAVLWNDSVLGAVSFSYPAVLDPGPGAARPRAPLSSTSRARSCWTPLGRRWVWRSSGGSSLRWRARSGPNWPRVRSSMAALTTAGWRSGPRRRGPPTGRPRTG